MHQPSNVRFHGPLAQLVAHLHDAQGVGGSSPSRPTPGHAGQACFARWRLCASGAGVAKLVVTSFAWPLCGPGSWWTPWLRHVGNSFRTRFRYLGDTGSGTWVTRRLLKVHRSPAPSSFAVST